MMKKTLLIITENIDSTKIEVVKEWLEKQDGGKYVNFNNFFHCKDFSFIVVQDSENKQNINNLIKNNGFKDLYFVLHKSSDKSNSIKKKFDKKNITKQIIFQTHEPEGFYNERMPLLVKNTANLELSDILEGFFETKEERRARKLYGKKQIFLHKLLGDKLEDKVINKKLKKFGCDIPFVKNNKHNSIESIRNEIFKES